MRCVATSSSTDRSLPARWKALHRAQRERSAALDRVRSQADLLAAGLYVPAGPTVWRRVGVRLPDHLRRTKSRDDRGRRRRVLDAARGVLRPPVFRVRRSEAQRHEYPIAVATFDGGVVLLDPGRGKVARTHAEAGGGDEELRRRLARHVATPEFSIEDDGRLLIEEFVDGDTVLDLPADEIEQVVRALVDGWTRLTAAEADGTWDDLVDTAVSLCSGLDLPPEVLAAVERGVPDTARGWPLVPAATDATLRNVVLRRGEPVLIDLGDVRLEPSFSYPLGAIADAGPRVITTYLAGGLDDALAPLAAAVGTSWPPSPWSRLDLLAIRTCVVTLQAVGRDRDALTEGINRRWRPVRRALEQRAEP